MKKKTTSLQKLTESQSKIEALLAQKQITLADLEILSESEKKEFYEVLNQKSQDLKGVELDKFWRKIEPITHETTRNELWESNHTRITVAISKLMQEYGRMPSKTEIASSAELSRQTVHKHLKEFAQSSYYAEQVEQFKFMASKVLARVFYYAVNGDVKAAKLYLSIAGSFTNTTPNNTLIQTQNNYIQINGTVISQETIKSLNHEQLNSIETILKTATSPPEFKVSKL